MPRPEHLTPTPPLPDQAGLLHHGHEHTSSWGRKLRVGAVATMSTILMYGAPAQAKPERHTSGKHLAAEIAPRPGHRYNLNRRHHQVASIDMPTWRYTDQGKEGFQRRRELHLDRMTAYPADIAAEAEQHAAFVDLGDVLCSSWIVTDQQTGEPVGQIGALHCDDTPTNGYLGRDANGQIQITPPRAAVYSGNVITNMTKVGDITSTWLPQISSQTHRLTHDFTISTFQNQATGESHTVGDVLRNVNIMPAEQVRRMGIHEVGKRVFVPGWPALQSRNPGPKRLQLLSGAVIGNDKLSMANSNGQTVEQDVDMLLLAMPENADGASGTPGVSGAGAFVKGSDGKAEIIGTASAYFNLKTGNKKADRIMRQSFERRFGVDLKGASVILGISYRLPSPRYSVAAHVRPQEQDNTLPPLPELTPEERLAENFRELIYNPEFPKQTVDGAIDLGMEGHHELIDRPFIAHYAEYGETAIAWYDSKEPLELHVEILQDDQVSHIPVYSLGKNDPSILPVSGEVTAGTPDNPGLTITGQPHTFGIAESPDSQPTTPLAGLLRLDKETGALIIDAADPVEADIDQAEQAFFDAGVKKTYIPGYMRVISGKGDLWLGGEGAGVDLFHDQDGSVVVLATDNGKLYANYFANLDDLRASTAFYAPTDQISTEPGHFNQANFVPDLKGYYGGAYQAEDGTLIGGELTDPPTDGELGRGQWLDYQNGDFVAVPLKG